MKKKIFVSNRAGIGDVILTTPVLKALKEKYPDSHVTFMIGPNCLAVADGLDFVDEIVTYDKRIDSMWKVVKKIWRYDVALCLDFKYRTPVMALLAGIPVRAGLKHKRKLFLSHPVEKRSDWEQTYEPQNYANVIKDSIGLDLALDLEHLYLPAVSQEDIQEVKRLLAANGKPPDSPFICISPFTSWPPKNWPIASYRELILRLVNELAYSVVLIGTKEDAEQAGDLRKIPGVVDVMGKTSLPQMAEVIREASLFVGGCSAPLHMAAAGDTPFVAMYGATSPARWAPRTRGIVITKHPDCGPCNDPMRGCEAKPCMTEITANEVYEACLKWVSLPEG